ncbi:MAG: galactokinase [Woeseiaceae bacterium]|nr:galactokinase [Woeseiaceae bacterium]
MSTTHEAMIESVIAGFEKHFGGTDGVTVVMAPGRVNLIGDHTDHNDGFVLPMTIDRGIYVAIRPRTDGIVRVASIRYDELAECKLGDFETPTPGSWQSYVLGIVEELRLRGHLRQGFDAVVDGNLNLGAGLSSSAALEVATAASLREMAGFDMNDVDLVTMCQHVEHKYAHVLCGIMDQFACGVGKSGHALMLDCRSLDYEHVPIELGDHRIVIISSEVSRSLASSAYNTRRAECQEGVEYFSRFDASIRALRDVSRELFDANSDKLTSVVRRRCRHVLTENQRVLDATELLKAGDLQRFGDLMKASHRSLRDDFEVSCPEVDLLVNIANRTDGVLGSRMTGGGFGGCTVTLAHKDAVAILVDSLTEYTKNTGLNPGVFVLDRNLEAGPVAHR